MKSPYLWILPFFASSIQSRALTPSVQLPRPALSILPPNYALSVCPLVQPASGRRAPERVSIYPQFPATRLHDSVTYSLLAAWSCCIPPYHLLHQTFLPLVHPLAPVDLDGRQRHIRFPIQPRPPGGLGLHFASYGIVLAIVFYRRNLCSPLPAVPPCVPLGLPSKQPIPFMRGCCTPPASVFVRSSSSPKISLSPVWVFQPDVSLALALSY